MEAEVHGSACSSETPQSEEEMDLRRGPWTLEEDLLLVNYIAGHGEGRWNLLARCAGLKRTGKSCRLRWLNYLRPDVRRGNITPEEQLLILELHSLWGNRWSRIAQHLPGRTDNEIKNYWRTRVQKHAKHLQCDVDSKQFKDVMRYLWMPRLIERIRAASRLPPPEIPAAEYGALAGGDRTFWPDVLALTGRGKAAVPTTDGWSDSRKPSNTRTMSSGGFEVREKRNRGEGVQVTAPPQLGGGKWPGEPSLLNQAYARAGLPELEQYCWGPGAEMNDNLWNMEDSNWFLQ